MTTEVFSWLKGDDSIKTLPWKQVKQAVSTVFPSIFGWQSGETTATPSPQIKIDYDEVSVSRYDELEQEVIKLNRKIEQLAEKFNQIEQEVIPMREVSYAQAEREIAEYFGKHDGEEIDAADIQDALGINIFLVMEVFEKLEKKGKIRGL